MHICATFFIVRYFISELSPPDLVIYYRKKKEKTVIQNNIIIRNDKMFFFIKSVTFYEVQEFIDYLFFKISRFRENYKIKRS